MNITGGCLRIRGDALPGGSLDDQPVHFSMIKMASQREGGTLFDYHPGHFSIDKHSA